MAKEGELPADTLIYTEDTRIAVIGSPLVGQELIEREQEAAPLNLFKTINSIEDIMTLPVGSKGVLTELNGLFSNRRFEIKDLESEVDLVKSAGPSTCFIAVCPEAKLGEIMKLAGRYYHILNRK